MSDEQFEHEDMAAAPEGEKLQKVLARCGLGSRREMEREISAGRVTVNGQQAKLGDRVLLSDTVELAGKRVRLSAADEDMRVLLYNKPEGEICTRHDPEGRPTVFDRLPRLNNGRWIQIGRLDINTSGLLLFTNNGELANKLMHPSSNIDREYLVRVRGELSEDMRRTLTNGVELDDGPARFTDIAESPNNEEGSAHQWYYCVVMEGRNREVRRLWESQGLQVNRLKRVRFGNIFVPSHVRVGQWIELGDKELKDLCSTAGLPAPARKPFQRRKDEQRKRHVRKLRSSAQGAGKRNQRRR
ncbi:23S rRNA pseudouridine(2605) synthase RluB [Agaribacterium haliotis]|uniref:23S rRNA pseudouridine(2605) synthase RluB n=1 Tax=Agaribacterium haliotis TaxID=2013869 RepID=UPI001956E962|nr:pseudouridine synthase [Agaribacterium haliotis]